MKFISSEILSIIILSNFIILWWTENVFEKETANGFYWLFIKKIKTTWRISVQLLEQTIKNYYESNLRLITVNNFRKNKNQNQFHFCKIVVIYFW